MQDLPSWVQAIGSILAILVAVAIAHRDTRIRRRDRIDDKTDAAIERFAPVLALAAGAQTDLSQARKNIFQDVNQWDFGARGAHQAVARARADAAAVAAVVLPTVNGIRLARAIAAMVGEACNDLEKIAGNAQAMAAPTEGQVSAFDLSLAELERLEKDLKSELVHYTSVEPMPPWWKIWE